jgi:hypothetical protein
MLLLRSGLDEQTCREPLDVAELTLAEWVKMLSELYPSDFIPADWDWVKETLKAHFPELDMIDIALYCIIADLSDLFVDVISPMKNHAVLAAYKAYFDKPRHTRRLFEFGTLATAIVNASREFRSRHPEDTIRRRGSMQLLEWCMLADALNNTKLGGNSAANLLMSHSNGESWENSKSCAMEFALAAGCTITHRSMCTSKGAQKNWELTVKTCTAPSTCIGFSVF